MRDKPSGVELLELARQALRGLADELAGERRYTALMIGSAMAMAARELEAGAESGSDVDVLRALLGCPEGADDPVEGLARTLRAGRLDGDVAVYEWLQAEVENRVKISNPNKLRDNY